MARQRPKREQSAADIAEVFDVHEKTVRAWARDGCPHTRRGRQLWFNDAEVQNWLNEVGRTAKPGRPSTKTEAEREGERDKEYWLARKYRAQVLEIEGRLVDAEAVRMRWANVARVIRSKLQGMGGRVASRLVGLGAQEIQRELDAEVEECLRALADDGLQNQHRED